MIGLLFDMFTVAMFFLRDSYICIHWDGKCWLARFHAIRNFLASGIYHLSRLSHQTGCLFTWEAPAPYNQLLIQPLLLVPECYLGFWNFKPIYLKMQFSLIATLFSLLLVICLSWYLHLELSHEFLTFISFYIWR